jgi:hypothetical protein
MKRNRLTKLLEIFETTLMREPWKAFEETTRRSGQQIPHLLGLIDDNNDDNINDDALSTVRQNTTIFKKLIYIICVNRFIEVQLYYMFQPVEPSSGNTCLQESIS